MLEAIHESHRGLPGDDVRASAFLATTMADGSSQVTPLWFDAEGDATCIHTTRGRTQERNMAAQPCVALAYTDMADAYRCVQIRGTVIEKREPGAEDYRRRLSRSCTGSEDLLGTSGQVRMMVMIRPGHRDAKP